VQYTRQLVCLALCLFSACQPSGALDRRTASDSSLPSITLIEPAPAAESASRLPEAPQSTTTPTPEASASSAPPRIQIGGDVNIDIRDLQAEQVCIGVGNICEFAPLPTPTPQAELSPAPLPETEANSTPAPEPTKAPTPEPSTEPTLVPEPNWTPIPTPQPTLATGNLGPVSVASFSQAGWSHVIFVEGAYVGILAPDNTNQLVLYRSENSGQNFVPIPLQVTLAASSSDFQLGKDPTGAWLMVWKQGDSIFLRRSTDKGLNWGAPIEILASFDVLWKAEPHFITQNGQTWLTFTAYRQEWGRSEVFLTRVDSSLSFTPPVRVTQDNVQNNQPQVAVTGQRVYIAWQNADTQRLMFSVSSDGGQSFAEPVRADQQEGTIQSGHMLLSHGQQLLLAYAAYVHHGNSSYSYDVFVLRSSDGQAFDQTPLSDITAHTQERPRLAIAPNGTLYGLWADNRINKSYGTLAYAKSQNTGASFADSVLLSPTGPYSHGRLTLDPDYPDQIYLSSTYHNEANGVREIHFFRIQP
jgi:hypothetical protein